MKRIRLTNKLQKENFGINQSNILSTQNMMMVRGGGDDDAAGLIKK